MHGQIMRTRSRHSIPELREVFTYNPATGKLSRNGRVVGSRHPRGFLNLVYRGQNYRAHRLAAALMTGQWPDVIDHINRDQTDNRWSNLRITTQAVNLQNRRSFQHQSYASRDPSTGRFMASPQGVRAICMGGGSAPPPAATPAAAPPPAPDNPVAPVVNGDLTSGSKLAAANSRGAGGFKIDKSTSGGAVGGAGLSIPQSG